MRDFRTLLISFKEMPTLIEPLTNIAAKLNSSRLKVLCTLDTEGGLLPSGLNSAVEDLEKFIVWKRLAGDSKLEVPEPQEGIDEDFDRAN